MCIRDSEYVKNFDSTLTTSEVRDLSYSLMMSTATIVNNEEGNPYSPRKQGAGLADIKKSVSTKAYLTVDGSNKPKASLGDDPSKTGEYTIRFNIVNVSGSALSYNINPVVMTESMSSDGKTVAERRISSRTRKRVTASRLRRDRLRSTAASSACRAIPKRSLR